MIFEQARRLTRRVVLSYTAMREHALFAVRNLLKSNKASQDYVCVPAPFPSLPSFHLPPPRIRTSLELEIDEIKRNRDALKPQYRVGDNGELLDLPPPLRQE